MHHNITLMDLSNQYVHEIFSEDSWHYTQIFVCTVSTKSFQEESRPSATNLGLYSEQQRWQCQCLQPGNPQFSHSRAQRFYINIAAQGQQERSGTSWALRHEGERLFQPQGSRLVPACDPKKFSLLWRSTEVKPDWQHSEHDGQTLQFLSCPSNSSTQNSSCPIPQLTRWQSSPPSSLLSRWLLN